MLSALGGAVASTHETAMKLQQGTAGDSRERGSVNIAVLFWCSSRLSIVSATGCSGRIGEVF